MFLRKIGVEKFVEKRHNKGEKIHLELASKFAEVPFLKNKRKKNNKKTKFQHLK